MVFISRARFRFQQESNEICLFHKLKTIPPFSHITPDTRYTDKAGSTDIFSELLCNSYQIPQYIYVYRTEEAYNHFNLVFSLFLSMWRVFLLIIFSAKEFQ